MTSKRALGRGLGALLGDSTPEDRPAGSNGDGATALGDREARILRIADLSMNPHQPRKSIAEEQLHELAQSIRSNGVLQPVLVRRRGDSYELIAGERRVRAAEIAGLQEVPAIVCSIAETESMKVALLENIQREDLNAIEEAEAYRSIMEHLGATHQELADMLGKSRSGVSNMLRLLNLEQTIRNLVVEGGLTMGHARALLRLDDGSQRLSLARTVAKHGLSVRALEKKIQDLQAPQRSEPAPDQEPARDPEARALREFETRLFRHLGSPCQITRRGNRGRINIEFFSDEELERILESLGISSQL
ncbi:MAG TPA: ParB/RepB/Spo0J family partition protein [Candidatus Krumholzibacteria bacterium]|nr:ParB/RepB/Spo0J family partition protein [Candidatus Krumholzibacteria bacterium]